MVHLKEQAIGNFNEVTHNSLEPGLKASLAVCHGKTIPFHFSSRNGLTFWTDPQKQCDLMLKFSIGHLKELSIEFEQYQIDWSAPHHKECKELATIVNTQKKGQCSKGYIIDNFYNCLSSYDH